LKPGVKRNEWHPAFVESMKTHFFVYGDQLAYTAERNLTSKPLQMDLLIIKKQADLVIDKSIGRYFRGYNVLEYKRPDDYVSIVNFQKVCAYAWLYASLENLLERDITITFVQTSHPRKLLKHLRDELHCTLKEPSEGIYVTELSNMLLQIVEVPKLDDHDSFWVKNLSNELDAQTFEQILNECGPYELDAYLYVLIRANPDILKEVNQTMPTTLEQVLKEIGFTDRIKMEDAVGMLKERIPIDVIARCTGLPIAKIEALQTSQ
jgi:hypothetical protein